MEATYAVLLMVVLVLAWLSTFVGLPGNWLMALAVAAYAAVGPNAATVSIGWPVVLALVVLAGLGEGMEFLAGALGVTQSGGSRRGAVFALIGSMVGALVGVVVGLPVPLVGPILAALLFASAGALLGAMLGERQRGRSWSASWRIGVAAFRGRLLGTLAKAMLGLLMIGVVIAAILR
jgi:uncharacterized protein YqgC (DUF456 family)